MMTVKISNRAYKYFGRFFSSKNGKVISDFNEASAAGGSLREASVDIPDPKESSSVDLPEVGMCNPYLKEGPKCFLCANKIELDYKNPRLLQQFVSNFSGRVYDRHITGLCDHQQEKLLHVITLSRKAGYMPVFVKDPKYLRDPKLFDPLKPLRPHSYA